MKLLYLIPIINYPVFILLQVIVNAFDVLLNGIRVNSDATVLPSWFAYVIYACFLIPLGYIVLLIAKWGFKKRRKNFKLLPFGVVILFLILFCVYQKEYIQNWNSFVFVIFQIFLPVIAYFISLIVCTYRLLNKNN